MFVLFVAALSKDDGSASEREPGVSRLEVLIAAQIAQDTHPMLFKCVKQPGQCWQQSWNTAIDSLQVHSYIIESSILVIMAEKHVMVCV